MTVTPQTNCTLEQLADALRPLDDFVICGHVSPDGDCLGSQLGLAAALKGLGKRVTCLLAKDEPINLASCLFVCVRHSGPSDKSNTRGICFILPPTLHFLLTFTQRQSARCLSKMRLDRD